MKDYREKELKNLLLILVFLFMIWCTPLLKLETSIYQSKGYEIFSSAIGSVIVSAVLSLSVFLCDCLISSKFKDKLVGLFFIPRPGATIFSRIKNGKVIDDRFLVEDAENKYCNIISILPIEKKARYNFENFEWYKMYLIYQERGQVKQSQRDYLVCRDLFVETILFFALYCLFLVVFSQLVTFSLKFVIALCFVAIVSNRATHVKMDRFVNTVIAVDIATDNKV